MHKLKYILLFFCFAFFSVKAGVKHPLHVSTAEINFNAKDKILEISCKIFSDDFEAILAKLYKQKTDLSNPNMKSAMDELVKKYLLTHLQLKTNGKAVAMNYIGFEIDHEATNIYLEVEKVVALKSIEVNDSILYDMFDDQMSIIHVVKDGKRKSTKILYPEKKFTANF